MNVMEIVIIILEQKGNLVIRVSGQRPGNLTRGPILPYIFLSLISCLKNENNNNKKKLPIFFSSCLFVFFLDNTRGSPLGLDYICMCTEVRQEAN